jgi:hypothetical protein
MLGPCLKAQTTERSPKLTETEFSAQAQVTHFYQHNTATLDLSKLLIYRQYLNSSFSLFSEKMSSHLMNELFVMIMIGLLSNHSVP